MTKHGLMLTIPQLKLLQELIVEYNPFYYQPEEVEQIEEMTETVKQLIAEVTDPARYQFPDISNMPRLDNSRGYHKC
jgi:hypothetical protein